MGLDQPLALKPWNSPSIVLRFASKAARKGGSGTANLNGSLLCDSGRTLEDTFSSGCFTTYGLNYDKWGTSITPVCTPGAKCWKDVKCAAYPPSSLPPASYVNNPPPICVAAKNGQVQAFQAGIYNRFEDPANGFGGCSPNNWPKTDGRRDPVLQDPADGGYDFTNDPALHHAHHHGQHRLLVARTRRSPSSTSPASTHGLGHGQRSRQAEGLLRLPARGDVRESEQRRPPPPRLSRREHHEPGQRRHVGPLRQVRRVLLGRHAE